MPLKHDSQVDLYLYWGKETDSLCDFHINLHVRDGQKLFISGYSPNNDTEYLFEGYKNRSNEEGYREWAYKLQRAKSEGRCIAEALQEKTAEIYAGLNVTGGVGDILKPMKVVMRVYRPQGRVPLWRFMWAHQRTLRYEDVVLKEAP